MRCLRLMAATILALALASPAAADWYTGDPFKWVQAPDIAATGIDVNATGPFLLADDFECTQRGPITEIHVWGSWLNDVLPIGSATNVSFTLSIHEDVPADSSTTGYSMPGDVLWWRTFEPGEPTVVIWQDGIVEGWLNPPGDYFFPADTICWQYNFFMNELDAFTQEGSLTETIVYWLDVQATPLDPETRFGWKASVDHWNDAAVWVEGVEPFVGVWSELRYPPTHEFGGDPIDLAFVIAGPEEELDWGDAPDPPYPTDILSDGARHVIVPGVFLGAGVDPELNGQPSADAMGDDLNGIDDEDGVVFTTPLVPGEVATVEVTASAPGVLDAWVDFDNDGSWAGGIDPIFISMSLTPGVNPLSFVVPAAATPGVHTFARFRFSTAGGLSYDGPAPDGEVEDLRVFVGEGFKWTQEPDVFTTGLDVNATEPYLLADDFECTESGVITTVTIWGSWKGDIVPVGGAGHVTLTLSFHEDIPADESPTGYSMPGDALWWRTFAPGEFATVLYEEGLMEGWFTPPDDYTFPGDSQCWQYTFAIDPADAFHQEGSPGAPVVYWLDLQATPPDPVSLFGWKSSFEHWNDDAVWVMAEEPYLGNWFELRYPPDHPLAGDSIDLAFQLVGEADEPVDCGDAPDPPYPSLFGNNGPSHTIVPGLFLGALIDPDPNGQPDSNAMGDDLDGVDDEDGVTLVTPLVPGQTADVVVVSSAAGFLDGWIDFGGDGGWTDAGDQVFTSVSLAPGSNTLTFGVPATSMPGTQAFARFRFSTLGGLSYTGPASDGEVEDYAFLIVGDHVDKWTQNPDLGSTGLDVNASEPYLLADDFECTQSGAITTINVWGSWKNDVLPAGGAGNVTFTLSIHDDIPADVSPTGYSMPGDALWWRTFAPGEFATVLFLDGLAEGWFDPPDGYVFPGDTQCWLYTFVIDETDAFHQEGSPALPIVYWLDVQATPPDPNSTFGWKSSMDHWNDDAVWVEAEEPFVGDWFELRYPPEHPMAGDSIDLAFTIGGDFDEPVDCGDAPDPPYPSLFGSLGPSHVIVPGIHLGALIDPDPDGQPDPDAMGDDLDGVDDEDGIAFTSPLVPGMGATIDVTASVPGILDGWIDFGADGSWAEAVDYVFPSVLIPAGTTTMTLVVPTTALGGHETYARFRFNTVGGLPFTGPAFDGEVEDYEVFIEMLEEFKYIQYPDLSELGMDVNATLPYLLADDFLCDAPGRITEIYVWTSWLYDEFPTEPQVFTLSIHKDIPADESPTGYSMPGDVLWYRTFFPTDYSVDIWAEGLVEGWFDPPDGYIPFGDSICWLYTFFVEPSEAFHQTGVPGDSVIYWLDFQMLSDFPGWQLGWKTSWEQWNDDAVWTLGSEPYVGDWSELRYPLGHPMVGESIDLAFGVRSTYGTGVPEEEIPRSFGLYQNVPNPLSPTTTIEYDVPAGGGLVTLQVFDVSGRLVVTLVDGRQTEGRKAVAWNGVDEEGRELPSGVYFYRLRAPGHETTRKMLLVR